MTLSSPSSPSSPSDLRHLRAVFAGAARNCAAQLPGVLNNMSRIAALYGDAAFVIAENDSDDETQSILREWHRDRPNRHLITLDGLAASKHIRTERIATARNSCLEYVRTSACREFDHFVMFDMDDVNMAPIAVEGFVAAVSFLEREPARAAVFANQRSVYYDLWTLRHANWVPGDIWQEFATRPRWLPWGGALILIVHRRQISIHPTAPPIRVRSAFGGLGIYKLRWVLDASYNGFNPDGTEASDHVALNYDIGNRGGELYIFPGLLNEAPPEHLFNPGRFRIYNRILMRAIRVQQAVFPPWKQLYAKF